MRKKSMSKKVLIAISINAAIVEIYSMVIMACLQDLSALYYLIAAGCTQCIAAVIGYFLKSKAENTVGGITYDTAMQDYLTPPDPAVDESEEAVG